MPDDRLQPSRPELERAPERSRELDGDIVSARIPPPGGRGTPPGPPPAEPPSAPRVTWRRFRAGALAVLAFASILLVSGLDRRVVSPPPAPPATQEVVNDEIVVDFEDSVTDEQIAALGASLGIQLRYNSPHSVGWKGMVATVPPQARQAVLTGLRASPLVEAAGPQTRYHLHWDGSTPPNDPGYSQQWHFGAIGMESAWKVTRGKGAIVAVIDSGVASENFGFWRRAQDLQETQFVAGYDFVNQDEHPEDDVSHGTHVTGTIAESTGNGVLGAGIAPEAAIMPLKALDANGGSDSNISDAIHYAADHGANVINMSIGGPTAEPVLQAALAYAHQKGVTIVCSAGNDALENGPNHVKYPAHFAECITVSAVGPQGTRSPYSDYGDEVDIAAPGGDTTNGAGGAVWQDTIMLTRRGLAEGLAPKEGTSMAAPHVTGVAALLVSLGVKDPDEIRSILRRTAKPRAPAAEYGAGLLDAAAAVDSASHSGRQMTKRWWLVGLIAVVALGIAFFRWKDLGENATLLEVLVPLAIGVCLPDVVERIAGFGSLWNMLGHSVLVPLAWLQLRRNDTAALRRALAVTVGLVVHLAMDAQSGTSPFAVLPPWRATVWMVANAAVGCALIAFAFEERRASHAAAAAGAGPSALAARAVCALLVLLASATRAHAQPGDVFSSGSGRSGGTGGRSTDTTGSQTIHDGEPDTSRPGGTHGRSSGRTRNQNPGNLPPPPGGGSAGKRVPAPRRQSPIPSWQQNPSIPCSNDASNPEEVPAEIRNQQEMIRLVWKRYGTGKSIGIFRVTNMPNTCLVILAGTEPLKPLIQNTHFLEDLKAGLSLGDPFRDSILRALGSSRGQSVCPRGSRLILAGHSLGGMEGQLVATDPRLREAGYSAMSVITFGAPKVADEAYETDDDGKIVRLTLYRRFSAIGDSIPESTRALDFVRHYQDAGSTFVDDRPPRDRDAALRFATEDLEDLKKDPVGLLTFLAAGVPAHMSYPCIAELAQYDGLGVRRTAPVTLRLGREAYFFSPRVVHLTD